MPVMGPRRSRDIIVYFVWTIAIAALFFPIDSHPFRIIILFNAVVAMIIAVSRHEPFGARKITLWDEAVGLIGVCALAHILH